MMTIFIITACGVNLETTAKVFKINKLSELKILAYPSAFYFFPL